MSSNRNFDLRGLPTSIDIAGDTRTLAYNPSGFLTSLIDGRLDHSYDYDLLGRLTDFTNNNAGQVSSPPGPMFSASPVVLATIQTANNETSTPPAGNPTPWLTAAVQNATASSVEFALERSEVDTGSIVVPESIGYIAIENGTASSFSAGGSTISFVTERTSDSVRGWDNGCYGFTFATPFASNPTVVATKSSRDDDNGGWVRRCSLSSTAIGVAIDEDEFRNSERRHNTETVDYAAFSQDFDAVLSDPAGSWQMEANTVVLPDTSVDPTFKQVFFRQAYAQPPVVVVLATNETPDPTAIRIRNVTTIGFEAAQVEPAGNDGVQGAMTLQYIAVEPGAHELPDGTRILAATVSTSQQQHGKGVGGAEGWQVETFAAWPGSTAVPIPDSQLFTYDANGNRDSLTEDGTAYAYTTLANSNRLLSAAGPVARTVSYDASGNIISAGIHSFGYDDRGRLVSIDSGAVTYAHNGQGQRVSKNDETETLFVYNEAGQLIGEYDAAGTAILEHVWFAGAPVSVLESSAAQYVHTDHLGTPRSVSDGSTTIWRWEADPFGSTQAQEDADGDGTPFSYNLRFPGQYWDTETGLHYNYFRTYSPGTGRYVKSDPIGLAGGPNSYEYVYSDPTGLFDSWGLSVEWSGTISSAGATVGFGGQLIRFNLESECKCNRGYRISGFASLLTIGGGVQGRRSSASFIQGESLQIGNTKFKDPWAECPEPRAANGFAFASGIGAVPGVGTTFLSRIDLGRLTSTSMHGGPTFGLDFSVQMSIPFLGRSVVTSVEELDCCSG